MATIQPDGRFTLKTFEDGDGVVPGKHTVTVSAKEQLSSTKMKWYAPKKYANMKTSDRKVTIEEPTENLVIELTWKGDKHGEPFVENFD